MPTFERKVSFDAAYDKRNDPKGNYGIHGVHIWFTLIREDRQGITFSVSTDWQLPHVALEQKRTGYTIRAMGFPVSYHAHKPQNEYSSAFKEGCSITGGDCYSNSSGLLGDEFLATLISEGDEGLWKRMETQLEAWLPFKENEA